MRPLLLLTALAVTSCHQSAREPEANRAEASVPPSGIKGVHRDFAGKPAPAAQFNDPAGKPLTLAAFKGKPLLVNLWASWCAPCVKELPTLDVLARSGKVKVLAVSEDNGPHASVVAFLQKRGVSTLQPYQDPKMGLMATLGPDTVLPTSLLIDANGKEVWRYVGELDWTSPEAARLLAEAGAATATH
jgi:thiol-disulfide isomerase/thioredoxin